MVKYGFLWANIDSVAAILKFKMAALSDAKLMFTIILALHENMDIDTKIILLCGLEHIL